MCTGGHAKYYCSRPRAPGPLFVAGCTAARPFIVLEFPQNGILIKVSTSLPPTLLPTTPPHTHLDRENTLLAPSLPSRLSRRVRGPPVTVVALTKRLSCLLPALALLRAPFNHGAKSSLTLLLPPRAAERHDSMRRKIHLLPSSCLATSCTDSLPPGISQTFLSSDLRP